MVMEREDRLNHGAKLDPCDRKRKSARPPLVPIPVYNRSLLDAHRAEKVARVRVNTIETQLVIQGRQKHTRYATAMLRDQDGEEGGPISCDQMEKDKQEKVSLLELFGIDVDSESENENKEAKSAGDDGAEGGDEGDSAYEEEESSEEDGRN
ncbi:hypothetical protein DVH05_011660 [Phytophthora capsici]|nr:hypothetical protein DVH05_011658 [Phytophthora capsici]KAG1700772.1 hypothetical protein DVH05_011659 [Phytophthora capsici]KAG1700773.1 hypothetical protein DVH05_011660 [Phytophthora capsici]